MMFRRVARVLAFLPLVVCIGCSGRSVLAPSDDADTDVPFNPCPASYMTDCAGICYDLRSTDAHCGTCTHACTAPHPTCSASTCR